MKIILLKGLGVATLAGASLVASAATFQVLCDGPAETSSESCSIKMTGQIVDGDAARLVDVLKRKTPPGWRYGTLILDSPGGSVRAAVELASVVRRAMLDTSTFRILGTLSEQRACVSACFLVWISGAQRQALGASGVISGQIGLHRPIMEAAAYNLPPEKVAELQQRAMAEAAEFLQRELVPRTLIEKMLQRPSTEVYWATFDEVSPLTGKAPWFEEMMIARCGWKPAYELAENVWISEQVAKGATSETMSRAARNRRYLQWRRAYNGCEYGVRANAQAAFR